MVTYFKIIAFKMIRELESCNRLLIMRDYMNTDRCEDDCEIIVRYSNTI
jgi:hypothetical protein